MYPWVSDGGEKKYVRAVAELNKAKLPVTEDAVKALYIKYGGLVLDAEAQVVQEVQKKKKAKQ